MIRKTMNPTEFAVKLKICLTSIDERGIKLLKATFWLQIVVNPTKKSLAFKSISS